MKRRLSRLQKCCKNQIIINLLKRANKANYEVKNREPGNVRQQMALVLNKRKIESILKRTIRVI
jgi:hypothetical protein